MNNKVKIITAVVGVIVVGLGVTLMQPKTTDIVEPIVPVMVEEIQQVEETQEVEEIEIIEEEAEEIEEDTTPEEIGEAETIEVITEPEQAIEVAQVQATEPTPVVVVEPEPTPVVEATPEAELAIEEQATYVPAPQEPAQAQTESSGGAYIGGTWYNGTYYQVTQEQMDRATIPGFGHQSVDGIPTSVFSSIANPDFSSGSDDLTSEEFAEKWATLDNVSDTVVKWG